MFIDEFDRNRDARDLIHICLLMNLSIHSNLQDLSVYILYI
jgi:hypothetical protein